MANTRIRSTEEKKKINNVFDVLKMVTQNANKQNVTFGKALKGKGIKLKLDRVGFNAGVSGGELVYTQYTVTNLAKNLENDGLKLIVASGSTCKIKDILNDDDENNIVFSWTKGSEAKIVNFDTKHDIITNSPIIRTNIENKRQEKIITNFPIIRTNIVSNTQKKIITNLPDAITKLHTLSADDARNEYMNLRDRQNNAWFDIVKESDVANQQANELKSKKTSYSVETLDGLLDEGNLEEYEKRRKEWKENNRLISENAKKRKLISGNPQEDEEKKKKIKQYNKDRNKKIKANEWHVTEQQKRKELDNKYNELKNQKIVKDLLPFFEEGFASNNTEAPKMIDNNNINDIDLTIDPALFVDAVPLAGIESSANEANTGNDHHLQSFNLRFFKGGEKNQKPKETIGDRLVEFAHRGENYYNMCMAACKPKSQPSQNETNQNENKAKRLVQ